MRLYALHDSSQLLRDIVGAVPVTVEQARALQQDGYGVFWTPNPATGRRLAVNVKEVRYWFVELDEGSKATQLARLRACPLLPTAVIESKNGYHAYWRAVNGTLTNWKRIVRWGLVPALGGDPKATDVSRILRAPGFLHLKDRTEPHAVEIVWESEAIYTEEQMLRAFPSKEQPATEVRDRSELPEGATFWQRVAYLDGREVLPLLNGHWLLNGESFYLVEQHNGNANIIREDDKYSTGCFIDKDGRFGNVADGASIAAWCRWYGHTWPEIKRGLLEVLPELEEDSE